MNSVNIIGRLASDPEIRETMEGSTICYLTLAVDDIHSKNERTDFLRIDVFGTQANLCEKYLKKGFLAGITGRLRTEGYADHEGKTGYSMSIIAENVRFLQWPERHEGKPA